MWIRIVRISLLVLSIAAMGQACLLGLGMFVIANVFCDSGPLRKCFQAGLLFLGAGTLLAACVLPVVVALASVRGRLFWYLKVYPFLLVLLGGFAMHWYETFPMLSTRVAIMCAVMALLTCTYVFLSRSSKVRQGA
jgi:hypothetical protein